LYFSLIQIPQIQCIPSREANICILKNIVLYLKEECSLEFCVLNTINGRYRYMYHICFTVDGNQPSASAGGYPFALAVIFGYLPLKPRVLGGDGQ
jgi:hypothetical protein